MNEIVARYCMVQNDLSTLKVCKEAGGYEAQKTFIDLFFSAVKRFKSKRRNLCRNFHFLAMEYSHGHC